MNYGHADRQGTGDGCKLYEVDMRMWSLGRGMHRPRTWDVAEKEIFYPFIPFHKNETNWKNIIPITLNSSSQAQPQHFNNVCYRRYPLETLSGSQLVWMQGCTQILSPYHYVQYLNRNGIRRAAGWPGALGSVAFALGKHSSLVDINPITFLAENGSFTKTL